MKLNLAEFIRTLIGKASLGSRSEKILSGRFGLGKKKRETLQALGDRYSITRERVRQLEEQAMRDIRRALAALAEREEIIAVAKRHLDAVGGVREHGLFVREMERLLGNEGMEGENSRELVFLFDALGYPFFSSADEQCRDFWYADEESRRAFGGFHDELVRRMKRVERAEEVLWETIRERRLSELVALGYIAASRRIAANIYGDVGLAHWELIVPKTVRAKSYLLLKKTGESLHFTEIAERIACHSPTVHNELIKDPRCKLVGRGMYVVQE
ncbi:MAG: hypothetical protein HY536_01120 [Candidatus Colwellbacteria bacterium]|nr:hypothetical protein [Candidatus Colwellbacteria bacterium]